MDPWVFAKQSLTVNIPELVSHLCPWLFIRAVTPWRTFTFIFCHGVSLSASLTKTTVAATAWRHGGPPSPRPLNPVFGQVCDRALPWPHCLCEDPQCSVICFSCTKRLNSRVTSGSPNVGVLVKSVFISLKAFSSSAPHSRGSLPDPAVALNKGLAISEKPGIQIQQNPAARRNSWTSLLVFGRGIEQMGCFLSCPSARCPFEMIDPGYLTSCLQV